ncbi:MAG TPA: GntR family transcriptional regulator [Thermaerobacter sp.]
MASKQELAYRAIRQRILDGTYGPGYRLVIDALARELGISPVPVREAIRRLEAEGWVVYRAHAGAEVAPVDPQQWGHLMEVLAVLEGTATAAAAPRLTAADLEHLESINQAMAQALAELDVMAFGRLNRQFHFAIYAGCPNPYLIELLHQTWDRLDRIRSTIFRYVPNRGWESIEEHRQLLELIRAGAEPVAIEAFARQHKLRTVAAYRTNRPEPAGVPARGPAS